MSLCCRATVVVGLLCASAAAVCADERGVEGSTNQVGPPATSAPDSKEPWSAIEPSAGDSGDAKAGAVSDTTALPVANKTVVPDREIRRGKSAAKTGTGESNAAAGDGWWRSIGSLGAVVGVILFLAWGYRATTTGTAMRLRARRPGLIQIISRTSLSGKQSFCLVRVGPRMVLVGVSGDGLRTLDVIDDADLVSRLAGEAETTKAAPAFQAALERDLGRYENESEAPASAPPSNARSRIAQVLERLARVKG